MELEPVEMDEEMPTVMASTALADDPSLGKRLTVSNVNVSAEFRYGINVPLCPLKALKFRSTVRLVSEAMAVITRVSAPTVMASPDWSSEVKLVPEPVIVVSVPAVAVKVPVREADTAEAARTSMVAPVI